MASLKTFLEKGHKVINYNDSKFYYVLGEAAGYTYPTAGKIYNSSWHPGQFPWRNKAADSVNYKQDIHILFYILSYVSICDTIISNI